MTTNNPLNSPLYFGSPVVRRQFRLELQESPDHYDCFDDLARLEHYLYCCGPKADFEEDLLEFLEKYSTSVQECLLKDNLSDKFPILSHMLGIPHRSSSSLQSDYEQLSIAAKVQDIAIELRDSPSIHYSAYRVALLHSLLLSANETALAAQVASIFKTYGTSESEQMRSLILSTIEDHQFPNK